MKISEKLKTYKEKKAKIETTEARIEAYLVLMEEPDLEKYGYCTANREMGMPRAEGLKKGLDIALVDRDLTRELIREWIEEDRSRIRLLKIEVVQIEAALKSLTSWEEYIVRLKYFENLSWSNIEISFNNQYPQKNNLTQDRLKQINREAIEKLESVLSPFYEQLNLKVS